MFFLKELQHTINLHPSNFGSKLREQLEKRLYAEVEGSCSGRFGYIISVVDVVNVGKGKVYPGQGVAQYNISYRAIVFKPYKGEVVDAVITTVNKMGFFAEVGPLTIFVSTHVGLPEIEGQLSSTLGIFLYIYIFNCHFLKIVNTGLLSI